MLRSLLVAASLTLVAHLACARKLQLLDDPNERIEGEYFVKYHDTPEGVRMLEDHLLNWQDHFAEEPWQIGKALGINVLHATLTEEELAKVEATDAVEYIEHNMIVRKSQSIQTQNNPTQGLDRIDQGNLANRGQLDGRFSFGNNGAGVDIYILDTGIDVNHPGWSPNQARFAADCAGNPNGNCLTGVDPGDPDTHGTHVAGTAASPQFGVAKGANVISVRVLGANGSGTVASIVNGIEFVLNAVAQRSNRAVINMSLGARTSRILNGAAVAAWNAGIVVVVAAGNEAQDVRNVSPASEQVIITVGASATGSANFDEIAPFSNTGVFVDLFAPGVQITSLRSNSDGLLTISGTSMSSPHVAGACAMLLATNPQLTPEQVKTTLLTTATQGTLSAPQGVFPGTPNALLNVQDPAFGGAGQVQMGVRGNITNTPQAGTGQAGSFVDVVPRIQNLAQNGLSATGVMVDLRVANGALEGMAPELVSVEFLSTRPVEDVRVFVTRNRQSYNQGNTATNADSWENGQLLMVTSPGTRVIDGVRLTRNIATLATPIELNPGSENGLYITTVASAAAPNPNIVSSEANAAGTVVASDNTVQVVSGRAVGTPFSNQRVEGVIPAILLGYSRASATLNVQQDVTGLSPLSSQLECLSSNNANRAEYSNHNGVMFDLTANQLGTADLDGVFLQGFSVYLMDNMLDGIAEVWTTIDGGSYVGRESTMAAWRRIGSMSGMDMSLAPGDSDMPMSTDPGSGMDQIGRPTLQPDSEDERNNGLERPSTPEMIDLNLNLNFELRSDGEPQGFYLTFRQDQMRYYQSNQPETSTIAVNEFVTMTGGKGVAYPFGGDNNQIFDMRQFAGSACFRLGPESAASAPTAGPVTLLAAVVASVFIALFGH